MSTTWFCELHRITTASDCPQCDAERIAELERYARRGLDACAHENVRTFRSVPPHAECLDCGAVVVRHWVEEAP